MQVVRRISLLVAFCFLVTFCGPAVSAAEESAKPPEAGTAQTAPGAAPSAPHEMTGCPHKEGEACCGACQEKAAAGQPAKQPGADCPCQHAKEPQ